MAEAARLERVLLVEDEPDIRRIAKIALERFGGLVVEAAASGEEAVRRAPAFAPDVVLLDVMMPGIDGPETLSRLRALAPLRHTPVVFLTAKVTPGDVEHLKRLGARGVIAKPFDPVSLPRRLAELVAGAAQAADGAQASALDELEALRREYGESLQKRAEALAEAWRDVKAGGSEGPRMRQLAHGLAGSGATLGFPEVSRIAAELERMLGLFDPGAHAGELVAAMDALVESLRTVAKSGEAQREPLPAITGPVAAPRPVVLVEDDEVLARALQAQLGLFGFETSVLTTPALLEAELARRRPAAVLMDVMFGEGELAGPQAVFKSAILRAGDIPVVFISGRTDLTARLAAMRAGAADYLPKPLRVADLVDVLDRITDRSIPAPYRVLVVGAGAARREARGRELREVGLEAELLADPAHVPGLVAQGGFDAIVLHDDLGVCSTTEMTQVIRQVDRDAMLPVVVERAEAGDASAEAASGRERFAAQVRSEARRYRMQRALLAFDALTGLANHSRVLDQLDQEVGRALRHGQPLSVAMIDVDHFKRVNDEYGHATGDRVLSSLGRFLRQRLRRSDFVGRYGGEEFMVLMPGTPPAAAARLVEELREGFAAIRHFVPARAFSVCFSAGVASCPPATTAAELAEEADRALYRAKSAGRNRVESGPLP